MSRRGRSKKLKLLAVAVIAATAGVFFYLRHNALKPAAPPPEKHQTGYKTEDRHKLEQLMHDGGKDE